VIENQLAQAIMITCFVPSLYRIHRHCWQMVQILAIWWTPRR